MEDKGARPRTCKLESVPEDGYLERRWYSRVTEGSNIETDIEPDLSLLLIKRLTVLLSLTVTSPVSSSRNS